MAKSGLPDYGMYAALENMGRLVDYAELAARLGSIVTYNREGYLTFYDDFEKTPLKWAPVKLNGDGFVGLSNEYSQRGGQCLKLQTTATQYHWVGVTRYFPLVSMENLGMEIVLKNENTDCSVIVYFNQYINGVDYIVKYELNFKTKTLSFHGYGTCTGESSGHFNPQRGEYIGHYYKLVIDNHNHRYLRFLYDRKEYNLKDCTFETTTTSSNDASFCRIYLTNLGTGEKTVYIDNVILTQNEP